MNYAELRWHQSIFRCIAYRQRPKCFLELGLSDNPVMLQIAPYCTEMVGVDPGWQSDVPDNATVYKMTTDEFFRDHTHDITRPDLVFVDADHDSEQVVKDLHNVSRIAATNCVVLIHDTFPADFAATAKHESSDSWRVPGKIPWESVTLPFPPGLTIARMNPLLLV